MTVEFIPENNFSDMSVSNRTWFILANTSGISNLIGHQYTNDPVVVDGAQAKEFAELTKIWEAPDGWVEYYRPDKMKAVFIDFFENSGGFKTH